MTEPSTSDRRLLEHVLEGQREQQISLSELHLIVAGYHAEAQRGNETMGVLIKHVVARCEDIEEEAATASGATSQRLAALDARVKATEVKLVVIGTACTVVGTIAGVLWKVLGG
jgi:hypothetical protein